jgi:hypothetical protein
MMLNATFTNISVISWRSVLLQITDKLYHIMLNTSPWLKFVLKTSVVIDTDCIGSRKSNTMRSGTRRPLFSDKARQERFNEMILMTTIEHVSPLGHIILIPLLLLLNAAWLALSKKAANTHFIIFALTHDLATTLWFDYCDRRYCNYHTKIL